MQVARIAETFDSITFSAPSNLFVTNDIITSNAFAGDSYSVFDQSESGSDNESGLTISQDYVAANSAVSDASNAYQNVQNIIDSANSDGLITPAEKEAIDQAIKEAENNGLVSTIERVGTIRIERKNKEMAQSGRRSRS